MNMKKLLVFFAAIAAIFMVSCTNEEDTHLIEKSKTLSYVIDEGQAITLNPLNRTAGANYRWYVDNELVGTEASLKFKGTKSGVNEVVLKTNINGVERTTTYSVSVTYQLLTSLNTFSLNSSNGTSTTGGYYWNQTYSNTNFTSGIFTFSHTGGDVSGYNYWDGFTVSNVADITNYGAPGSSDGWIAHQWGCMAENPISPNFLIGYWGYYMKDFQSGLTNFTESGFSNWVKLGNGSSTYNPQEVSVAIHPWPYYGNLYGDGFARPFVLGDYFVLKVYGVNASNQIVGPVNYYMADYRTTPGSMSKKWNPINITSLGAVKYLMFQMESTDASAQYGPNTAVYFCLKNIKVTQN